jgi:hypothetical protein
MNYIQYILEFDLNSLIYTVVTQQKRVIMDLAIWRSRARTWRNSKVRPSKALGPPVLVPGLLASRFIIDYNIKDSY